MNGDVMNARLIKIGNSRGIRLPKSLIEEVGLIDAVDLSVENGALVIRPKKFSSREGWEAAFAANKPQPEDFDEEWLNDGLGMDDDDWTW